MTNQHTTSSSYQHSILVNNDMDIDMGEDVIYEPTMMDRLHSVRRSRPLLVAFGFACFVAALVVTYHPSSSSSISTPSSSMLSVADELEVLGSTETSLTSDITPCTFDECAETRCNAEAAPYNCLWHNGGVHGGCSAIPWADETCDRQCDISGCDSLVIPDSQDDCDHKCPQKWCDMGRICGDDAPFQCQEGSSAFGCSADSYQWTFRVSDAACSACCKSSTCSK